jgi:iron complex transport system ATP-binding protein
MHQTPALAGGNLTEHLVLNDCSVSLGRQRILHNISLSLASPGLYCIIGSNGAGKTTLLRMICGLLQHAGGQMHFGLQDMGRLRGSARAALVSYVPQIADDAIPLRVHEALEISRRANPDSTCDVSQLEQLMGLEQFSQRPLSELSGGELKRAMIAQALAQDTRIMLLDEPSAHLDPPARLEIMALLRHIALEQGRLVIASLHYPELAAQFATQVVLLRDGRVLASGDPTAMTTDKWLSELYGAELAAPVEISK